MYGSPGAVCQLEPVKSAIAVEGPVCTTQSDPNYSPLNASVAFAFLSFIVWVGNVWFVYKETPYHDDGTPPQTDVPTTQ